MSENRNQSNGGGSLGFVVTLCAVLLLSVFVFSNSSSSSVPRATSTPRVTAAPTATAPADDPLSWAKYYASQLWIPVKVSRSFPRTGPIESIPLGTMIDFP